MMFDVEYFRSLVVLAEENDKNALYTLWNLLDYGYDLNNTTEWEYRWYLVLATKYEDTEAMMCLYELYKNGIYVAKDEKEALKWLTKALKLGDTVALREIINYYFSINNYEDVINNYNILLNFYLVDCEYEFALKCSFAGIDDECIKYITKNYKGFL